MFTSKRRSVGDESREKWGLLADSILGGGEDSEQGRDKSQSYRPRILRKPIALTGISILVLLGVAILVLEHVVNDVVSGLVWTPGGVSSTTDGHRWEHYLSSLPTFIMVLISAAVYGFIMALHNALKGLEPYRRLSQGNASADESLLLDYISMPSIHSTYIAIKNGHFIVATSGVAALLALSLSPLASTSIGILPDYDALIPAYSAVNSLASIFLTGAPLPPYVTESWAFPSFDLEETGPAGISNSTIYVPNYPGLISRANCEDTVIKFQDASAWANAVGKSSGRISVVSVAYYGLPFVDAGLTQWPTIDSMDEHYYAFITSISSPLTETKPKDDAAVFPNMSTIVCYPTVELQHVQVSFDAATRTVYADSIVPIGVPGPTDLFNGTSAAFNAINFGDDIKEASGITVQEQSYALLVAIKSVIYEASNFLGHLREMASALPGGLSEAFASDAHYKIVSSVYETYLSLVAQSTYFNSSFPNSTSTPATSTISVNKLFVSKMSAVIMCSVLMVLAVLALAALIVHHRTFSLHLRADPGTMAGKAMMLAGGSDVARLLADPEMTRREMKSTLREHRWALVGGKVCVVNEVEDFMPRSALKEESEEEE
ncbi:hypothetical protein FA95DRAFT_1608004 [Auriscalpium vulgare]|uniref:Uncharacterized protein n=1 Tax=Auriscalpium vulgare TaxID=40419 RepID=A0ACB8RLU0_9AGAM|nr:hypothetical protein FA95DRAFT_1608004 [Auriscalpium vulgare]